MLGSPAAMMARIAEAPCLLIMLDYDGTLSPIVQRPSEATMAEGTVELLEKLNALPGTAVAIISGRAMGDLRNRIPCEGIVLFGNHGLECLGLAPLISVPEKELRAMMASLEVTLQRALSRFTGVLIENKGPIISVHYRQAVDEEGIRKAAIAASAGTTGLLVAEGKKVLEFRPDLPINKGTAVRTLVQQMEERCGRPLLALYAGDDTTDEDAFAQLEVGVTILVGDERHTRARYRLEGPSELRRFLEMIVQYRSDLFPVGQVRPLSPDDDTQ